MSVIDQGKNATIGNANMVSEQMKLTPQFNKLQDALMSISSSLTNDPLMNKLAQLKKERQSPTFKGGERADQEVIKR